MADFEFQLDPKKHEAFMKIVNEKYNGDLHAAVKRAIDYFLMYENSQSLQNVGATLNEIKDKIAKIREMNTQISERLKTTSELRRQNPTDNSSNGKS